MTFDHVFGCLDLPGFLYEPVYEILTALTVKVICY